MNGTIKHTIAITGQKRSGKDTSADYLAGVFEYQRLAFADPIKDILCHTLGISRETLDDFKNNPETHKVEGIESYGVCIDNSLEDSVEFSIDMRQILTNFGDAMKKQFGEDIWANKLVKDALFWDVDKLVVPDLRYLNEYQYLKEYSEKLIVIKIHKDGLGEDSHSSEQEYKSIPADYEIYNNGSIQELHNKLNKIVSECTKSIE